jgi:hypothetical protein
VFTEVFEFWTCVQPVYDLCTGGMVTSLQSWIVTSVPRKTGKLAHAKDAKGATARSCNHPARVLTGGQRRWKLWRDLTGCRAKTIFFSLETAGIGWNRLDLSRKGSLARSFGGRAKVRRWRASRSKVLHATCYKVGFAREFDDFGGEDGAPKVLHATKWEKS